ncbi:protein 175-like [Vespula squamosa]|uniref:Protein 175-like n=1 Tax=Vespula squamosa TaxID=30214 RepID=A0ABD1ZTV4_VESSQ
MENSFRIIYALCIIFIRFPLYYLFPVENTFVIYNNTNFCDNPIKDFLYESKYTKNCTTLKYPKEIDQLKVTETDIEMFVCLRTYDTIYKACKYAEKNQWANTIHDKKNLDLVIQNLTKSSFNDLDMNNLCISLSEFIPMNKTLKLALTTLKKSLNDTFVCKKVCFDLNKKMIPLCAVLEWINEIDQDIVKHVEMDHNNLNIDAVNDNNRSLKKALENQVNHRNQSSVHHDESSNDAKNNKSIEKGIEMKKNQSIDSSIIPVNNANDNDTNNNGIAKYPLLNKNGNNHMSDQQNDLVKSTLDVDKVTLQPVFDSTNIYSKEIQDKPHSEIGNVDKKQQITISNSQEPPPIPEKDDSKNKKEEKVDSDIKPANNKIVNSLLQNKQTETKSTVQSNNTPSIENIVTNSNVESSTHISDEQQSNLPDSTGQSINEENQDDNFGISIKSDISVQKENYRNIKDDDESHFFTYFAIISLGFIAGYIGYHNKQKILAIVLEGRRSKNNRGRRRPSTANYRKLDCTLEEAVTSQCNANVTHVIY